MSLGLINLPKAFFLFSDGHIILLWNICYTMVLVDMLLKLVTIPTFLVAWCVFQTLTQHLYFGLRESYIISFAILLPIHLLCICVTLKEGLQPPTTDFQKCWFDVYREILLLGRERSFYLGAGVFSNSQFMNIFVLWWLYILMWPWNCGKLDNQASVCRIIVIPWWKAVSLT